MDIKDGEIIVKNSPRFLLPFPEKIFLQAVTTYNNDIYIIGV